jgi:hypothetical protein
LLLDRQDPWPDSTIHDSVKITRFDPDRDLIIIDGRVWSPDSKRARSLSLVLDTGAAETVLTPDVLDELG